MIKKILILILLSIFFIPGIGAAADIPMRIISLSPPITEQLYDLGVGERVVGVTTFCQNPEDAKTKEKIGTILEPSIEKIVLLSPDVVLVTMEGNRRQTAEKLESLGIEIHVFKPNDTFEDIYRNFTELGSVVGKENEAREIVSESKRKIRLITDKLKNIKPISVFWEVGAKPLVTINNTTFSSDFIRFSGGINIFNDVLTRYPRISREEVIRLDPEVIILVTMGDVTVEEEKTWRKFNNLSAVKSGRIFSVEPYLVCSPTPNKLARGLEVVAALLHPEIFQSHE